MSVIDLPGGETLDECGLKFLLAVRLHTFLSTSLPPAHRAQLLRQGTVGHLFFRLFNRDNAHVIDCPRVSSIAKFHKESLNRLVVFKGFQWGHFIAGTNEQTKTVAFNTLYRATIDKKYYFCNLTTPKLIALKISTHCSKGLNYIFNSCEI